MFTEFLLTDGVIKIDFLAGNKTGSGISIARYTPGRMQAKDGGVWADNPMAAGRRVVHRVPGNVNDVLEIHISHRSQAQIIQAQEELDELLEKAHDYWTTNWQSEPVWIQAQAMGETHKRYTIVYGATWAEYPDPFREPFAGKGKSVMAGIQLGIERSAWLDNIPGETDAISVYNEVHTDSATIGTFVSSYHSDNIGYIFTRTSGGTFGSNLLSGNVPYTLFSDSVVDSSVLFGSDKPFRCLVFNIGTVMNATSWTITWEFTSDSGGTWGDLTGYISDETVNFSLEGTHIVYFDIPAEFPGDLWAQATFNSVTAFWVRARISAISGSVTLPTQTTRHVYAPSAPYVEIAEATVGGNMDALMLLRLGLRSAVYGIFSSNLRYVQEVIVGLRSVERGENFTAYINPKTADNPAGITVVLTDSAGHSSTAAYSAISYESPSGYQITWTGATNDTLDEIFRIQFDSSIVQEYFGRFRLFVRCTAQTGSTLRYRLRFSGSSNYRLGDTQTLGDITDDVVDLGTIEIPPTNQVGALEEIGTVELLIEGLTSSGNSFTITDVILLPADEWSAHITSQTPTVSANYYADIDSVTYPKQWARALVRHATSLQIIDNLDMTINQQAALHANTKQRLWFVIKSAASLIWDTAEVQIQVAQRYFNLHYGD